MNGSLFHPLKWLFQPAEQTPVPHDSQVSDEQLRRARRALRSGDLQLAEQIVTECGDVAEADADCLNLLGLIAEARGQWDQARKCWRSALRCDRNCAAAQQNLRRYFELFQLGRTNCAIAFGDENGCDPQGQRSA